MHYTTINGLSKLVKRILAKSKKKQKQGRKIMRIDKFLKVSRILKRRTLAAEACDGNRVSVNGKEVKPAYRLKIGDSAKVEELGTCKTHKLMVK